MLASNGSTLTALVALALAPACAADLVGHWKFDERSGAVANDSVGDNDGALSGDAAFVPGVSGNAVKVSTAGNGLVNFGDVFQFAGPQSFTISLWMRTSTTNSTTNEAPLSRHLSGTVAGYIVLLNTSGGCYGDPGRASFYQTSQCGGEVTGTTTVTDMEWHHVAVVHNDGGQSKVYVDGAPAEGTGPSTNIAAVGVNLLVGGIYVGSTPVNLYNGLVDDLQIYDTALAPCDIQDLFESPGQPFVPVVREDINGDRAVNGADLALLLGAWGSCGGCDADLDCDGTVGGSDLARVLGAWTG